MAAENQSPHRPLKITYWFVVWCWYDTVNDFPVQRVVNNVLAIPDGAISTRQWVLSQRRRRTTAVWISETEITELEYEALRPQLV